MRRPLCRLLLSLSLTLPLLGALCGSAGAATRFIRATGTSTGPGICSIIIESFGLLKGGQTIMAPFTINVSIPTSSTAINSAMLIRNDVDAALPSDYVVTIVSGQPIVQIDRSAGTFTMSVTENVPGQVIEEPTGGGGLPAMGAHDLPVLFVLLSAAGAIAVAVRRRRAL